MCDKAQKYDETRGKIEWSLLKCISSWLLTWNKNDKYLWRLPLILQNLSTGEEKHEFNYEKQSLKIVWENCCIVWRAKKQFY